MRCRAYPKTRDYENLQRAMFAGKPPLGIPVLAPAEYPDPEPAWISFNFMRGDETPGRHGLHFFLDAAQFARIWDNPEPYVEKLARYRAVLAPDFEIPAEYPLAVRQFNHYRKHWLAAWWALQGVCVIPTVRWGAPDTYAWCFDGEPTGSCLAVNASKAQESDDAREAFVRGYRTMLARLAPVHVITYGDLPPECEQAGPTITTIPRFENRWLGAI